ncbi:MAG: 3-deoxy-manno-octulosonate cytidylyltransferase [Alphaproteobacteria bacterium]|nr:MAG: 3-deoxy-manno-octulosonate cytidylyltransferase [Alphaproteobacteria bacterium]
MKPIVLIPARLASRRLPGKPLAEIAGRPMIAHVAQRALEAGIGPVVVATDAPEIAAALAGSDAQVVMTRADHLSGSDRIYEALTKFDPAADFDVIINLQGDLPTIDPALLARSLIPLADANDLAVDISTLAGKIVDGRETTDPGVVKLVGTPVGEDRLRALYFTRATAPFGEGPLYHHIGVYAFRRAALEKFVALPRGVLEKRERLEQLRALEAGMRIDAMIVDTVPLGVDTAQDLERARQILQGAPGDASADAGG